MWPEEETDTPHISANRPRPEVPMKTGPEHPAKSDHEPGPSRRHTKAGRTSRKKRALVLGPFVSCFVFCVIFGVFFRFPAPGSAGAVFVAMALGASVLWIVVAGLALALDRGISHADWSCFMRQDHASGDEAGRDWDTRTGSYAWMEDWEAMQFDHDDRHH